MTIQKALDMLDSMKPNMMDRSVKIEFLNQIENLIFDELVMRHEHTAAQETAPSYDEDTDLATEMLIPSPYDMLYVYWLMTQIDHINMEFDKYNNDRTMFETAYDTASDWYTRNHMPLSAGREFLP